MTEYRIIVKPGEPHDFTSDDGGICICVTKNGWVYFHGDESTVREVYLEIVDRLPEALPHLALQVRDVTAWAAA